ncbi:DNA topoisomerase (ATP-hydrolyzing) subunit B [Candidatus Acetothermia bacterium]|jgi:DNA gyrase subunit B|nr:DNA topoisomerase (ATP-hydrolyzing) subunit B [Candidatus Acetothermia bacterium]MCI2427461.1 DNA topoisomerase (ATP-hydrolyzing) subunit B [Candidatus Acetothermia bacterium]MCI2428858.1 DNA topoisomerase (ATP-hydrolyzing) subunit B [Candidatus Acetothermia bacterium]
MVYEAEQIKVLEDLEAVRLRPGMYIGSTGEAGLMHLIEEIVDNSIDEALAGYCSEIKVTVHRNNSVTVSDNGRGMPVGIHKESGINTVELVLTTLHSGGKFDNTTYKVSGGLHGVGLSVVNALSSYLQISVSREGKIYRQEFTRGVPNGKLEIVGETNTTGTSITFLPDTEIFHEICYNFSKLAHRLKELAYLNSGLVILLDNEIAGVSRRFQFKGGIVAFVKDLATGRKFVHPKPIFIAGETAGIVVEMALLFTDAYNESIFSFVNNINTEEGGTHLLGFKSALTKFFNDYGREKKIIRKDEPNLKGEDFREGLVAIINIKHPNPEFEGQTKAKLGNPEVHEIVASIIHEKLVLLFTKQPSIARAIIEKSLAAARARIAASKARKIARRKSVLMSTSLPGKLADCSISDPAACEIYIVEGDSAGGSAKQGRDRTFQAILPLRGKVLNVEKAGITKLLGNEELQAIVTALGTGINDQFDMEKLRYYKAIIMSDADIDGAHIRTLLLTFFFRYLRGLIEKGHLYIANPPLYQLTQGKKEFYLYSEEELERFRAENNGTFSTKRFKGLGEMNPAELWQTTMDPQNRILKRVTIRDALAADEIFSTLMGSNVELRRDFIKENCEKITNLDI